MEKLYLTIADVSVWSFSSRFLSFKIFSHCCLQNKDFLFVSGSSVRVLLTCVVWLSAALSCHGATLPGREKKMLPSLTISSDTKVTLMRTDAPGGRLPTLIVNTSCIGHKNYIKTDRRTSTTLGTLRDSGWDWNSCPFLFWVGPFLPLGLEVRFDSKLDLIMIKLLKIIILYYYIQQIKSVHFQLWIKLWLNSWHCLVTTCNRVM